MNPSTPQLTQLTQLTQMIRCPVTKSELAAADDSLIEQLNKIIEAGELVNQIGQKVNVTIESGFVNKDESLLLPQRGGIVILISDQAIPLDQIKH